MVTRRASSKVVRGMKLPATDSPHSPESNDRWAGKFLALASIGLVLVAVPTDFPATSDTSWHGWTHDVAYLPIPLGAFAAAIARSVSRSASVSRTGSRLLLPFMILTFAATGLDSIGELSRYFAFFLLLLWFEIVAWHSASGAISRRNGSAGAP
jgi:hypothetical protein